MWYISRHWYLYIYIFYACTQGIVDRICNMRVRHAVGFSAAILWRDNHFSMAWNACLVRSQMLFFYSWCWCATPSCLDCRRCRHHHHQQRKPETTDVLRRHTFLSQLRCWEGMYCKKSTHYFRRRRIELFAISSCFCLYALMRRLRWQQQQQQQISSACVSILLVYISLQMKHFAFYN